MEEGRISPEESVSEGATRLAVEPASPAILYHRTLKRLGEAV